MKLSEEIELKHFGVLGMKWGRRQGSQNQPQTGSSRKNITDNKVFKAVIFNKDKVPLIKKDFENAKKVGSAIVNNKVFKAVVYDKDGYGFISKKAVMADVNRTKKVLDKVKNAPKNVMDALYKNGYNIHNKEIARLKKEGKTKEASDLEKERDSIYTPEERQRWG